MKHIAAAALLALAGKNVDEKNVNDVLIAAGVRVDSETVKKLVKELEGKDVLKVAKEGIAKMGTLAVGSSAANAAPAKEQPKKEQPKKEEPKVEEEEDAGVGDLFGF